MLMWKYKETVEREKRGYKGRHEERHYSRDLRGYVCMAVMQPSAINGLIRATDKHAWFFFSFSLLLYLLTHM